MLWMILLLVSIYWSIFGPAMSADFAPASVANDSVNSGPGNLLNELEQRQDDVLAQLDELDAKLNEVLKGLGATMDDEVDSDCSAEDFSEQDNWDGEMPMAA